MKWGKVQIVFFIFLFCIPASLALANSEQDMKIFVNQKELILSVCPQFLNEQLTVPMRPFLESLGAEVSWDRETNLVTIRRAEKTDVFRVDDSLVETNEEMAYVGVPVKVYQGTMMVPLNFLAELLELDVHWNREQGVVEVESPDFIPLERFSDEEKECLPAWIEQWVESSRDYLDIQFQIKEYKLYLLSTFGEKTTGGYAVRISRITRQDEVFLVEVDYKESSSLPTIQVITRPYDLVYVDLDTVGKPSVLIFKVRGLKNGSTLPVRVELPKVTH